MGFPERGVLTKMTMSLGRSKQGRLSLQCAEMQPGIDGGKLFTCLLQAIVAQMSFQVGCHKSDEGVVSQRGGGSEVLISKNIYIAVGVRLLEVLE